MALTKTETIEDIRQLIINIILRHSAGANVNPGYPLYDLVVTPFADLIYEERQSIHILNNINRVLPLFNSDGTLINDSFKDYILNKYFIATEYNTDFVFTANVYMSKKCDMVVESGSEVISSGVNYDVTPIAITATSSEWKQEGAYFYHPIELVSPVNSTVPTSDTWDLSNLIYEVVDTTNSVLIKIATIYTQISSVDTSFNFETLQNSISNRSFNNPRALRYNLSTNSGFTPTSLKKYEILKLRDRYYIDSYMELFKSRAISEQFPTGFPVHVKTSNYSKLMLDYGYEARIIPITFEYTTSAANLEYSNQIVVVGDEANQIQTITTITSVTSPSYNNNYYWRITKNIALSRYEFEIATRAGVVYTPIIKGSCPIGNNIMALTNMAGTVTMGQLVFDYKEDVAYNTASYLQLLNTATYKIELSNTDGVLAPLAIFYNSLGDTTTYNQALAFYNQYISTSTDYINTSSTPCPIYMTNTQYKIYGDDLGIFGKLTLNIANIDQSNTDDYQLYWVFKYDSVGHHHMLYIYNANYGDRDTDSLVAQADLDVGVATATIIEVDSSGIAGTVEVLQDVTLWADTINDMDYDNHIVFSNSVRGFSNSHLYVDATINSGTTDQFHGLSGYMVALCSDPDAMSLAQQTLISSDNREIGNYIMVSPYRPIMLSVYFNEDYVYPFKDTEINRDRFSRMWEYLNTYFNDYTGNLSDVDFNTLVQDIQNETGLFLIRLDFTVATQRGHLIRGYINLKYEDTAFFNWNTVITDGPDSVITMIEDTVDDVYYTAIPDLKESVITLEKLYKPVLTKVTI